MGYHQNRYSPLNKINKNNVKRLVPVWSTSLDNELGEQAQPLIYEGVMYISNARWTYAIDALTGKVIWRTAVNFDPDTPRVVCCGNSNKGVAIYNGKVFRTTLDAFVIALDQKTGKEVWNQPADGFGSRWGTPILVEVDAGRTDLVVGVPYEVWGFNPDTGKLRWYCEAADSESMCSSVIAHDGIVYAIEGRSGGSIAVKAGGKDDVTKSHVVWSGRDRGRISTPIYHDGRLHWISDRVANALDAKTGQRVYQARLKSDGSPAEAAPPADDRPTQGGRRGGGGLGGGGGGRGGQDYASPVASHGRMYFVGRSGETYVVELGAEYKLLAVNRVSAESDERIFNSNPAISDGALFIRSRSGLYCVGAEPPLATK